MELVEETQEVLKARLRLVAELSRSAMRELRHPIDGGRIFRDKELGQVLESHGATFGSTDDVMAEFEHNSDILRCLGRCCWKTNRRFSDSTAVNRLLEVFLRAERTSREGFAHDASVLLRARWFGLTAAFMEMEPRCAAGAENWSRRRGNRTRRRWAWLAGPGIGVSA